MPAGLNWDLWIGPAPMRPYHRAYHPATWRCFWDFGCGMMGDRGAHTLDPVFAALKLCPPTSIEATSCGNTRGGASAVGDRHVPVPGAGRLAAAEADLVRRHSSAAAGGPGGRPAACRPKGGVFIKGTQGHDHGRRVRRQPADHPGSRR